MYHTHVCCGPRPLLRPPIHQSRETKPKKRFFFCAATTTKALLYAHVCTLYTQAHIHARAFVNVCVYVCMHVCVYVHCMCIVNAARSCRRFMCHAHIHTHMERTNLPRTHTNIAARSLTHSHMHKYITEKKLSPSVALRIVASLTVINLQQQ